MVDHRTLALVQFDAAKMKLLCNMKEKAQERLTDANSTLMAETTLFEDSMRNLHRDEGQQQSTCANKIHEEIMELSSELDC